MNKYKNFGLIEKIIGGEVYKFRELKNREKLNILRKYGEINALGEFKPNDNIFTVNFDYILATLVEAPLNIEKYGKFTGKIWKDSDDYEKLEILDSISDELLNELSTEAMKLIGLSEKKSKKSGMSSKDEAVIKKQ